MTDTPGSEAPRLVYEDKHLVVVDKPAGLLSQGDHSGAPSLVDWLRDYVGRNYVGLVHRLDRNTSGLLVVGLRSKAAGRLSESLRKRELQRGYLGIVEGALPARLELRHFLHKDKERNRTRVVPEGRGGREARLTAEAVEQSGDLTLARFTLETGRSHQIRVQLSAEGYPLAGDLKYGAKRRFRRPALHAASLAFPHPMGGEPMRFEAPLPEDLRGLLDDAQG